MSAELIGVKLGAVLMGLAGVQAVIDKSFVPLVEKAPYVMAVVGVVWIFAKLIEKLITDFRDTIRANQDVFTETAKECHGVQMRSIETDEKTIKALEEIKGVVQSEKDAIERLEAAVKDMNRR